MAITPTWLLLLLFSLTSASAQRLPPYLPDINEDEFFLSRLETTANPLPPAELRITQHVVPLTRAEAIWSLSAVYVQGMRRQAAASRATNGSVTLIGAEAGAVFLAPVTVGGQNFDVVVDTGSSDPWLAAAGYTCVDTQTGQPQAQALCYFGPTYNSSASPTYAVLPNENFNISYADGETLAGTMGYDSYSLGGVTVPNQELGLVNYAAWVGDGLSSGLVGFAYRTLTSAYAGTDSTKDQKGAALLYNPLFVNMYTNQGVPPVFSLAIDRDPRNGGVLAVGGVPDVPHSPYFASTPIIPVGVNVSSGQLVYEFYSMTVGGYAVSSSASAQFNVLGNTNSRKVSLLQNGTNAIVDSGTSLVYAPNDVAAAVAAAFNPPGQYDQNAMAYYVSCTAKPPVFGVAVGKKIFFVNPLDMILQVTSTQCISGIQPNLGGLTILGDVWMKNVLAVFDIGAEQMRFAAREFYGLTSQSVVPTT